MRFLSALGLIGMAHFSFAQDIAPTDAKSPEEERKSFKLPDGFEAQLVASEPNIQKPMQICFDAKGRLWVTTSYSYPFPAEAGKASDKLFVLSDFDVTGKAKKIEVFDDKLNIPIGVLPLPDGKSVIVSSVGQILKLTDTDGDGKADLREVLFDGFGTRDTHGMVNSFTLLTGPREALPTGPVVGGDGWVYACHGYLNTSKVKGKDGHVVEMNSGNTFRFRPDGSRIEVYTRGQVNPFGMTVDPWGNLYTADCHTKPITQLIRGAIYDSFGKPHDGLGYAPHVTDHDHGSTALCGLAWYQASHFPKEYQDCMFLGNVVTNKINADRISWKGSSPVAQELPDFLVSKDPWFRPTDIKLGPDGALYVSDFYNKIIGHYEVDLKHPQRDKTHGRIWRIVYTKNFEPKRNAKLEPMIPYFLRGLLDRPARDENDRNMMIAALSDTPRSARLAVESMIAHPQAEYAKPLFALLQSTPASDNHLVHATKIALRNAIASDPSIMADPTFFYARENPKANAAFIPICLGLNMSESAEHLARVFLFTDCAGIDRGVIAEHIGKNGGPYESVYLAAYLQKANGNQREVAKTVTGYLRGISSQRKTLSIRAPIFKWVKNGIDSADPKVASAALNTLKDLPNSGKNEYELAIGKLTNAKVTTEVKLAACDAIFGLNPKFAVEHLTPLCSDSNESIAVREKAASLAAGVREINNVIKLKEAIKPAPYRLAVVLASGVAADRFGAGLLFAAVKAGEAPARVLQERVVQDRLKAANVPDWQNRVNELTKGIPAADARLATMIRDRSTTFAKAKPDLAKGKELYAKNCAACHQVAGQGGKIGPNLDGIGNRGTERLLEDILDPNRNVDIAFRATTLNLADGRVISGLLLREMNGEIVMADNEGKEQRYKVADVEKRTQTMTSPMPADWGEKLKAEELHDLLAYTLSLKAK